MHRATEILRRGGLLGPLALGVAVTAGAALIALAAGWQAAGVLAVVAIVALTACVLALGRMLRVTAGEDGGSQPELAHPDERTRRILDRAHDAYIAIDGAGRVREWNSAAETMFGWRWEEAVGRVLAELIIPEHLRERHQQGIERYLETGQGRAITLRRELFALHRDGSEVPVEVSVTAIESEGEVVFHGFVRDITERMLLEAEHAKAEARAERATRVDAVTKLPTRLAWGEELVWELSRAARTRQPLCVALVDLDQFGAYTEAHGDRPGERLLRRVGSAWRLAVRGSDVLSRYDGDRFAVLLPDCPLSEARTVIERLRHAMPEGHTISAGIAEWDRHEEADALIDRAEFALHRRARDGRDRIATAA
jgi:PAS domain S-box-containing protein/diguanylate cyclase (GGDEF)-like protein